MSETKFKCISYSGGGFLISYHLGSASCLAQNAFHLLEEIDAFAGASAGSLVSATLAMAKFKGVEAMNIERCKEFVLEMAALSSEGSGLLAQLKPKEKVIAFVRNFLESYFPDDAHEAFSGKCFFSVTHVEGMKNELISNFETKKDLVDALVGSCFIPGYFGFALPQCSDSKIIDGGFTENLPIPPQFTIENTIRVAPYPAKVDIHPPYEESPQNHFKTSSGVEYLLCRDYFHRTIEALKSPPREKLLLYFDDGYKDTLEFLKRHDLCDTK